jgi:hypothetical protein
MEHVFLLRKGPLAEGECFLRIEKLKSRAFHLRLLIDSIDNSEVKEQAIKEYVRLIQQINGNN